jgi:hypothetical protein
VREVSDGDVWPDMPEHHRYQAEVEVMDEGLSVGVEVPVAAGGEGAVHLPVGFPISFEGRDVVEVDALGISFQADMRGPE